MAEKKTTKKRGTAFSYPTPPVVIHKAGSPEAEPYYLPDGSVNPKRKASASGAKKAPAKKK